MRLLYARDNEWAGMDRDGRGWAGMGGDERLEAEMDGREDGSREGAKFGAFLPAPGPRCHCVPLVSGTRRGVLAQLLRTAYVPLHVGCQLVSYTGWCSDKLEIR